MKTPLYFALSALAAAFSKQQAYGSAVRSYMRNRARRQRLSATGSVYPEQSSRQAMRGHRRAQGGPGIVLKDGVWAPRKSGELA